MQNEIHFTENQGELLNTAVHCELVEPFYLAVIVANANGDWDSIIERLFKISWALCRGTDDCKRRRSEWIRAFDSYTRTVMIEQGIL